MSKAIFRGAHAPSRVGFGAPAETFSHHKNCNSENKEEILGAQAQ